MPAGRNDKSIFQFLFKIVLTWVLSIDNLCIDQLTAGYQVNDFSAPRIVSLRVLAHPAVKTVRGAMNARRLQQPPAERLNVMCLALDGGRGVKQ